MNNPQETANVIKLLSKSKGISISKLLIDCELNKNALFTMQSSGYFPRVEALSRIADYFNCSIDYLLGRENKISAPSNNDSAPDNVSFLNNDNLVTIRIAARNGGDIVEQTFTREQAEFIKLLVDRSPDSTDPRI